MVAKQTLIDIARAQQVANFRLLNQMCTAVDIQVLFPCSWFYVFRLESENSAICTVRSKLEKKIRLTVSGLLNGNGKVTVLRILETSEKDSMARCGCRCGCGLCT